MKLSDLGNPSSPLSQSLELLKENLQLSKILQKLVGRSTSPDQKVLKSIIQKLLTRQQNEKFKKIVDDGPLTLLTTEYSEALEDKIRSLFGFDSNASASERDAFSIEEFTKQFNETKHNYQKQPFNILLQSSRSTIIEIFTQRDEFVTFQILDMFEDALNANFGTVSLRSASTQRRSAEPYSYWYRHQLYNIGFRGEKKKKFVEFEGKIRAFLDQDAYQYEWRDYQEIIIRLLFADPQGYPVFEDQPYEDDVVGLSIDTDPSLSDKVPDEVLAKNISYIVSFLPPANLSDIALPFASTRTSSGAQTTGSSGDLSITLNFDRSADSPSIRTSSVPPASVRDLFKKEYGLRWSRREGIWYKPRSKAYDWRKLLSQLPASYNILGLPEQKEPKKPIVTPQVEAIEGMSPLGVDSKFALDESSQADVMEQIYTAGVNAFCESRGKAAKDPELERLTQMLPLHLWTKAQAEWNRGYDDAEASTAEFCGTSQEQTVDSGSTEELVEEIATDPKLNTEKIIALYKRIWDFTAVAPIFQAGLSKERFDAFAATVEGQQVLVDSFLMILTLTKAKLLEDGIDVDAILAETEVAPEEPLQPVIEPVIEPEPVTEPVGTEIGDIEFDTNISAVLESIGIDNFVVNGYFNKKGMPERSLRHQERIFDIYGNDGKRYLTIPSIIRDFSRKNPRPIDVRRRIVSVSLNGEEVDYTVSDMTDELIAQLRDQTFWAKIMFSTEPVETGLEYIIKKTSQEEKLVKIFWESKPYFDVEDNPFEVVRGGAYYPNKDEIYLNVNTSLDFERLSEQSEEFWESVRFEVYNVLIHEMIHSADVYGIIASRRGGYRDETGQVVESLYAQDPAEINAFMQNVIDEVISNMEFDEDDDYIELWNEISFPIFVEMYSPQFSRMAPHLQDSFVPQRGRIFRKGVRAGGERERRDDKGYLLSSVAQALVEQGLLPSQQESERERMARRERYLKDRPKAAAAIRRLRAKIADPTTPQAQREQIQSRLDRFELPELRQQLAVLPYNSSEYNELEARIQRAIRRNSSISLPPNMGQVIAKFNSEFNLDLNELSNEEKAQVLEHYETYFTLKNLLEAALSARNKVRSEVQYALIDKRISKLRTRLNHLKQSIIHEFKSSMA